MAALLQSNGWNTGKHRLHAFYDVSLRGMNAVMNEKHVLINLQRRIKAQANDSCRL